MTEAARATGDPSFDRYARMVCRALGVATGDRHARSSTGRQLSSPARAACPRTCSATARARSRTRSASTSSPTRRPLIVARRPRGRPAARQPRDRRPRRDLLRRLADHRPHRRHRRARCARSATSLRTGPTSRSRCSRTSPRPARPSSPSAACATWPPRGAGGDDLSHRSRVLLALSEGLSATRTMTDVAQAVERIAVEQLGCLHAGIWLRGADGSRGPATTRHRRSSPSSLHRRRPGLRAAQRARCRYDDTNPLGGAAVHGRAEYFSDRGSQNAIYPHLDTRKQVGEARSFQPLITPRRGPRHARAGVGATRTRSPSRTGSRSRRWRRTPPRPCSARGCSRSGWTPWSPSRARCCRTCPTPECLELAARYRPAASRDQVGGDWYDAVVMPSGATSLMVGDVVGHDIAAAAVMGQLRTMLRTIAWTRRRRPGRARAAGSTGPCSDLASTRWPASSTPGSRPTASPAAAARCAGPTPATRRRSLVTATAR